MLTPFSSPRPQHSRSAFTLIELLVVIAIIAILAGLGMAGISGALKSARKAEVRAMLNQTKLAVTSYYADYGIWPAKKDGKPFTNTDNEFLLTMIGSNTTVNKRGIRYLEPAPKFTNDKGLVTPAKFYKPVSTNQSNFVLVLDTDYDGRIKVKDPTTGTDKDISGSVAVYISDPDGKGNDRFITTY
jgi:prepilin-type N-terminal cleavage/methylation domain-containing protein